MKTVATGLEGQERALKGGLICASPEVFSRRDSQESKTDFPLSINSSSDVNAKDKHAEDNQKRLAALEARQKAKEVQKKLVHNALANLVSIFSV